RENWKLGETAGLIFKKGKEALQGPGFLYIETQNGIREYKTSQSSDYSFIMEESDIPNVYVTGVFFNGTTYIESELFSAVYDYNGKKLEITAETDKSSYKPGETATIRITARNAEGLPVKAAVNASIVDEALFRLSGQEIDTLAALYSQITSGISFTYVSHLNSGKDILEAPVAQNSQMKSTSATEMAEISPSRDESKSRTNLNIAFGGAGSDNSYIREVFKDTAFFDTILLDENGKGELNLKLPDNVTSWRITLSGLSSDLRAGSGKTALDVSLPFFVNYTLNETYLEGDIPILGVSAYGKSLADGKSVVFEVSSKNNPGLKTKAEGKAFERVNIPLWQFKSGKDQIMIRAYTSGGLEDNIKHNVRILSTYHQAEKAIYYKASPDMKIEGGSSGNTTLVFSDAGRGAFLNDLTGLMYTAGNRIDQRLSSMIAIDLLKKYFIKEKEGTYWLESGVDTDTALKVSDYQTEDGGIALLPYGSSDPDISAKLSPYIKDEIDQFKLKQYFYTVLGSDSSGLKGSALYGLAVLREPVLIDIKKAASTENAGVSDLTWLALALSELGETWEADRLYTERIAPYLQKLEPYYRINTGKDNDDILECTSLAAVLASVLNKAEKEGLYSYCTENMTEDILINIERLMYISSELKKTGESISRLTYELLGEKHSSVLENGGGFTLTIPSVNLTDFHISSVEGNISAVSIFQAPLTVPANTDASINVQRMYSALNSLASSTDSISGKTGSDSNGTDTYRFNHNDIIKVELSWEMGAKALDGTYEITDFLPSGLKAIENTVNYKTDSSGNYYYGRIDGQKIRFYVYNSHEKTANRTLWYYARVISSGIYKADGTLIQSVSSRVSLNTGNTDMVEISGLSGF
ncbi:MAG: alpha-2-macroglobulin family protein, partial [Clostridiales bacterium]|nr:alpha-2-macroglobulin family protein [Clostridiales bacterium]